MGRKCCLGTLSSWIILKGEILNTSQKQLVTYASLILDALPQPVPVMDLQSFLIHCHIFLIKPLFTVVTSF